MFDIRQLIQTQAERPCFELFANFFFWPIKPCNIRRERSSAYLSGTSALSLPFLKCGFLTDLRFQVNCNIHITQAFNIGQHTSEQNGGIDSVEIFGGGIHSFHSLYELCQNAFRGFSMNWF